MSAIATRRATPADAPAIARVRIDSWRTTYRGLIPDAYLDGMQLDPSIAMWDRVLSAAQATVSIFVATHDDEVIGFAAGNRLKEPREGLDAEITAIYLRREYQRVGLGHRLCGLVVDAQRAQGATGMIVWVISGNRAARKFYEQLGGTLLIEQPFHWDGMDLVEAGYGFRDLAELSRACAIHSDTTSINPH
jgi:ribosomal protein S18 acetylase RimI-like enzyme